MLFAAGLGTRLKPFTENHPKALALVNGKPLLQRNIEYLKTFGVNEFVINVHHFANQILTFLDDHNDFGCRITISDETDELLETGGGLKKAAQFLKGSEPFVVMNSDILTTLNVGEMIAYHRNRKALATLATTTRKTSRYFLFNRKQELCGWENVQTGEKKISKDEPNLIQGAFSGIHVIDPAIFPLIKQEGKFSMVDVYLELCKQHNIQSFDHSSDVFVDVGKPESITQAEKYFP